MLLTQVCYSQVLTSKIIVQNQSYNGETTKLFSHACSCISSSSYLLSRNISDDSYKILVLNALS